jgi:hypothetical protein
MTLIQAEHFSLKKDSFEKDISSSRKKISIIFTFRLWNLIQIVANTRKKNPT